MDTTWTAPAVERAPTGKTTDERAALEDWLDFQRSTLLGKCAGLTGAQLAERAVPPSALSLLGLLRHMTDVERWWFRRVQQAEDIPGIFEDDAEWQVPEDATVAAALRAYWDEIAVVDAFLADADMDHIDENPEGGGHSLRRLIVHMIEEYARHCGHADLLREAIDGTTGD